MSKEIRKNQSEKSDCSVGRPGEVIVLPPPAQKPKKINLSSLTDARLELCRVYRDARAGIIDAQTGSRLAFILMAAGKMMEKEMLEERVRAIEERISCNVSKS